MHLGDLAFELQLKVLQLCTRQDLASLSRVHTSLKDVADYALYSYIHCSSFIAFRSILETLTTNEQKASLVKVFDVELIHVGVDDLRVRSLGCCRICSTYISCVYQSQKNSGGVEWIQAVGLNKRSCSSLFKLPYDC